MAGMRHAVLQADPNPSGVLNSFYDVTVCLIINYTYVLLLVLSALTFNKSMSVHILLLKTGLK